MEKFQKLPRLLTILPSVPIWTQCRNITFDKKFYDGLSEYCRLWPGTVRCVIRVSSQELPAFGLVTIPIGKLKFEIQIVDSCRSINDSHLSGSDTVLASGDNNDLLHISHICNKRSIRCIYIIEKPLKVQLKIVALNSPTLLHQLKRAIFCIRQEARRLKAFKLSDGVQANGVPSFESYSSQYKDDLLYFDNRIKLKDIISPMEIKKRLCYLKEGKPLRLAFSGRLIKIKGADDLIKVAEALDQKGVDFTFTIYGTGSLDEYIRSQTHEKHLTEKVFLKGPVDFHKTLLPALKEKTDLFICLHKQGDPSCTYLETLACGIPIVGYANEAFAGILSKNDIGWSVPMNDITAIAELVARLNTQRHLISQKSHNSIEMAKENHFDLTYQRRINHLLGNNVQFDN